MKVKKHAVRRYKKRILKNRTASRQRVVDKIKEEIRNNALGRKKEKFSDYYRIYTPSFTAVCYKDNVVTILPPR